MSLKSDVSTPTSILGRYLRRVFPNGRNRRILAQIRDRLGSQSPIWALDPDTSSWIRGRVGQAIDYRIRLHFARFQHEHLRMAREGAWAVARLDDFIGFLHTSPSRFPGYAVTPFGAAPAGSADWRLLCDEETEDGDFSIWRLSTADPNHGPQFSPAFAMAEALSANPARKKLNSECILEFFELLEHTVDSVEAHHRLPSASEERRLARFCLILAILDAIRRSNWPQLPAFLEANPPSDAESLLAAIPQPWVDDVAGLASSFRHRHADWHGAGATLNPTFEGSRDVGGADGDMIVNGCLWDIKTTLNTRAKGTWLYQLLGYVLLDYRDEHAIDHVGFLFPRQAASVCWNLQELADELSGIQDVPITDMRQEICSLLRTQRQKWRG